MDICSRIIVGADKFLNRKVLVRISRVRGRSRLFLEKLYGTVFPGFNIHPSFERIGLMNPREESIDTLKSEDIPEPTQSRRMGPLADLVRRIRERLVYPYALAPENSRTAAVKDLQTIVDQARESRDHLAYGISMLGILIFLASETGECGDQSQGLEDIGNFINLLADTLVELMGLVDLSSEILESLKK